MKKALTYCLLLFLSLGSFAQSAKVKPSSASSKQKKAAKTEAIESEVEDGLLETKKSKNRSKFSQLSSKELLNEAERKSNASPEEAIDLLERYFGISLYGNAKDPAEEQQAYFLLGQIYMKLKRYPSAVEAFKKAEALRQSNTAQTRKNNSYFSGSSSRRPANYVDPLNLWESMGLAYQQVGDSIRAEEYLRYYLQGSRDRQDVTRQIEAENLLGQCLSAQGRTNEADSHFQSAINLTQKTSDQRGYYNSLENQARNYQAQDDPIRARQRFEEANEVAKEIGDDTLVARTYEQIATTYGSDSAIDDNFLDEVIQLEQNSLVNRRNANDVKGEIKQINKISSLYLQKDDVGQAIRNLQGSLNLVEKSGELDAQAEAHELLAASYERAGRYKDAIFHHKKATGIKDSLLLTTQIQTKKALLKDEVLDQKDRKIADLQRESELREAQSKVLEERVGFQQRILWLLAAVLLVVSVSAFAVVRSNRARRRSNQLLALKSLRSQMNPHFIFNSLNSINGFIARHDDRTANKYLSDFSRLMRTVLDHSQQDFVALSTELEVLKLYVKLEHFRFGDKFDYELNIDPEIKQEVTEIPPMLVQPYIENAIWHGLRYKPEKGFLQIDLLQEGDRLKVVVEDNGIGRQKSSEFKTRNQKTHKSTGLKNTAQRVGIINELYKAELSVDIDDVYPEEEHTGTRVTILMPLRIREEQD
ncbi:MAG: histidine kinase [Bacteroidota bacterium]